MGLVQSQWTEWRANQAATQILETREARPDMNIFSIGGWEHSNQFPNAVVRILKVRGLPCTWNIKEIDSGRFLALEIICKPSRVRK